MGHASRDPQPLEKIAIIDDATISKIAAKLPTGGYVHPSSHPASMITESESHNFVSLEEKIKINNSGGLTQSQIRRLC